MKQIFITLKEYIYKLDLIKNIIFYKKLDFVAIINSYNPSSLFMKEKI